MRKSQFMGLLARNIASWAPKAAVALLLISLSTTNTSAQADAAAASATFAASVLDGAITDHQNALISRFAFGPPLRAAQGGASQTTSQSAAGVLTLYATGRTRTTSSDGFSASPNFGAARTPDFDVDERTVLVNASLGLQEAVFGGRLILAGFFGYSALDAKMKANAFTPPFANAALGPGSLGIDSLLYGATALWNLRNDYVVATIAHLNGDADTLDNTYPVPQRFNYDVRSTIATLTGGRWISLTGNPNNGGVNLDLRASVTYINGNTDVIGNTTNPSLYKGHLSAWHATASAMLFSNYQTHEGVWRPYFQATLKDYFSYQNDVDVIPGINPAKDQWHFDQARPYVITEIGVNYIMKNNVSLGAAAYFDGSADERTLGIKLGASYKFN